MKFLKELSKLTENATKDKVMDIVCHMAQGSRLKGISYEKAVKTIAAKFRSMDKHSSSVMSDEALMDMIRAYYNEDQHLAQDNAVTNAKDTSFDYSPIREGDAPQSEKVDRKAIAIGAATAWLKKNYKKYNLPLKVRRIVTSGQYMMTTVVANEGQTPKRVYLKVVDGEVKQVSSAEWKMVEEDAFGDQAGGSGSLDDQQQGGIPAGVPTATVPKASETPTPPPEDSATPDKPKVQPNKVIAKGGNFRVELGQNEQVSIIDGKGNIRLSMPMVIWQELTRQ